MNAMTDEELAWHWADAPPNGLEIIFTFGCYILLRIYLTGSL
jgi:hypothetical protein